MHYRSGGIHKAHNAQLMGSIFTAYVHNLPNSVGTPWFRIFFSNFGYVVDSYLPNERSQHTGNRFGFIRFDSRREVDCAINRSNGIWMEEKLDSGKSKL